MPLIRNSLQMALRPRTALAYNTQFITFLQFCEYNNYHQFDDVNLILSFLQFLYFNNISKTSMQNYLCAIRYNFHMCDLDPTALSHPKVAFFLKSVAINRPLQCKIQGIVDLKLLGDLVTACQILNYPTLYKSILLTAFFAFLRLPNLAPNSSKLFDVTRHLAGGDVILGSPGAHLIIKWSKTMQNRNQHQIVQIPVLMNTHLCPVTALVEMMACGMGGPHTPLFTIPYHHGSDTGTNQEIFG